MAILHNNGEEPHSPFNIYRLHDKQLWLASYYLHIQLHFLEDMCQDKPLDIRKGMCETFLSEAITCISTTALTTIYLISYILET